MYPKQLGVEKLEGYLSEGYLITIPVDRGIGGHQMLVHGLNDGKFKIIDPDGGKRLEYTADELKKIWKAEAYCVVATASP